MYNVLIKKGGFLALLIMLVVERGSAANVELSGFASFFGGITVSNTELPNGENSVYTIDYGFVDVGENRNRSAVYDDTFSFLPDSNYGLQIKSDLNDGLSVHAQLTGRGSQDFSADLEWVYFSLKLTNGLQLKAGRQRTPIYFFSDFLDVGYAYHWIRQPELVYANLFPVYDGVAFGYSGSVGGWAGELNFFGGQTENEQTLVGRIGSDALLGASFELENDFLRFFASTLTGDFYTVEDTGIDNPVPTTDVSVSLQLSLGPMFIIAESEVLSIEGEGFLSQGGGLATTDRSSAAVSAGLELGNFTPHVTVSQAQTSLLSTIDPNFVDQAIEVSSVSAGIRWDFHPSAAFKIEYSSSQDDSTELLLQTRGKQDEAAIVAMGFDIIF